MNQVELTEEKLEATKVAEGKECKSKKKSNFFRKHNITTKRLVMVAILTALSVILYITLKFPMQALIPIIPGFLDVNFSMLPIIICLFMIDWKDALVMVVLRFLIKLPMSSTMYVGEIADLVMGAFVVLVTALVYHYTKNIWLLLTTVVISWSIAGVFTNAFINVPLYLKLFFGNNLDAFVGAISCIPGVNESNYMLYYLGIGVIPFNLILSVVIGLFSVLVFKRLRAIYNSIGTKKLC